MPKIFISFHHGHDGDRNAGYQYRDKLLEMFGNSETKYYSTTIVEGDISDSLSSRHIRRIIREEYLQETNITIVLIGPKTWTRKHVDWEIAGSVEESRSGLLGLFLPNSENYKAKNINPYVIPPRLWYNYTHDYATLKDWSKKSNEIWQWVLEAMNARHSQRPHNDYPIFKDNKIGKGWQLRRKVS